MTFVSGTRWVLATTKNCEGIGSDRRLRDDSGAAPKRLRGGSKTAPGRLPNGSGDSQMAPELQTSPEEISSLLPNFTSLAQFKV